MKPRYRVQAVTRPMLTVVQFPKPQSHADVHSLLNQFVTLAKDGTIDGLAVSATSRDGAVHTAYHVGSDIFRLIGVTRHLSNRIETYAFMPER